MAATSSPSGHQALYRQWRAQTFSAIVGQSAVVTTLRNAIRLDRLSHGFLFVGPRGTGKTSTARILAKAVNCLAIQDGEPCDACEPCVSIREGRALDVIELDAASNNRVDDMRELLPRVYTGSADLRRKVFIIDEVQRIKDGWDVLLKTLEEPPDNVLFVFCTTDPSAIRPAVISRLQRFVFRPLTVAEIEGKLQRILAELERPAEPEAIELIARLAAGGMRDAESMLDQVLTGGGTEITAAQVRELLGLAEIEAVEAFVSALVNGDALRGIDVLDALEREGRDLASFAEQVVGRLREQLVEQLGADRADRDGRGAGAVRLLVSAARRLSGLDTARTGTGGYRFQLELALLAASVTDGRAAAVQAADLDAPAPSASGRSVTPASRSPRERPQATPSAARTAEGAEAAPNAIDPSESVTRASDPSASSDPSALSELAGRSDPSAAPETSVGRSSPKRAAKTMGEPAISPESEASAEPAGVADTAVDQPQTSDVPPDTDGASGDAEAALLERLHRGWPEVVAHVARNPANRPLISACRPIGFSGGIVVLGFPEDQPFLREIAERKRRALEDGLHHVLGRAVGVRCVVANIEAIVPVAGADGGSEADLVEQARRIFGGDLVDMSEIG